MKKKAKKKMQKIEKQFNLNSLEEMLEQYDNLSSCFQYFSISLASPETIKSWSQRILPKKEFVGEVLNSETINKRTQRPIDGGLFCEKIFGPITNWKCKCGKYSGIIPSKICEICKIELTDTRVRRYRMGYISLPTPVSHFWYFKNEPAYLFLILNTADSKLQIEILEKLIYFYRLDNSDKNYLSRNQQLKIYLKNRKNKTPFQLFEERLKMQRKMLLKGYKNLAKSNRNRGSEGILHLLMGFSCFLEEKISSLRSKIIKKPKYFQILRIYESFFATKTKFEWMILTVLPILPPGLRPLVKTENSEVIAADLNNFYTIIFERIESYKKFIAKYKLETDDLAYHEKRLIQYGVDAMIDNAKLSPQHMLTSNNRQLKSLTEILEGKFGRFRNTLLGKRVDYSGRSVIIVEPDLQLNEFGLPYNMAVELFKPYLINVLSKSKIKEEYKNAQNIIGQTGLTSILRQKPLYAWKLLEKLLENFSLLLNRAPTLHRFGIQAFLPILTPIKAIQLHPLVCTGFNADFDGDQMAVHLPLYEISQLEAKAIMKPSFNIFSPANGEAIIKPTQDIIIGCYYLSLFLITNKIFNNFCFSDENQALSLFYQKKISIHTQIFIRYPLNSLKIRLKNKKLFLYVFDIFAQKVKILKTLALNSGKLLLFTNIGIFLAEKKNLVQYKISDLFLSTTPGRLLLNTIFKNLN